MIKHSYQILNQKAIIVMLANNIVLLLINNNKYRLTKEDQGELSLGVI